MLTKWCLQSNLNVTESSKIAESCEILGYPCILGKVIPFSGKCPRFKVGDEPFVLIGGTTMVEAASRSRKYKKGVFFNKNFAPSKYAQNFKEHYINQDFTVSKIKDVPDNLYLLDQKLFIRSNNDSKAVSGGMVDFKELLELKNNTNTYYREGDMFSPDAEIFISTIKIIGREWRFVVVGGKVISTSQYKPSILSGAPDYAWEFARNMANTWLPHNVCALDICESESGLKVVECNFLNMAGFYQNDHMQIVRAVSEYQLDQFNAGKSHQNFYV